MAISRKQDRQGALTPAELDRRYGQDTVFNRLTNNGQAKGIYRDPDGNLYVNADYIKTGKLAADLIDVVNLIARQLLAENEDGDYVQIRDGEILAKNKDDPEMEYFSLRRVNKENNIFSLTFNNIDADGSPVSGSLRWDMLSLGSSRDADPAFRVVAWRERMTEPGFVKLLLPADTIQSRDLYAYWKEESDGTFTLKGAKQWQE